MLKSQKFDKMAEIKKKNTVFLSMFYVRMPRHLFISIFSLVNSLIEYFSFSNLLNFTKGCGSGCNDTDLDPEYNLTLTFHKRSKNKS